MEEKNKIGFERDSDGQIKYEVLNGFYIFTVFLENGEFFKIQLGSREGIKAMFYLGEVAGMDEVRLARHLIKTDFREDVFDLFFNEKTISDPLQIKLMRNLTPLELLGLQNQVLEVCVCLSKMMENVKKKD